MSQSIDPWRPYKPSKEDIDAINAFPCVCALQELAQKRKQAWDMCVGKSKKYWQAAEKYQHALQKLLNEKQQQRIHQCKRIWSTITMDPKSQSLVWTYATWQLNLASPPPALSGNTHDETLSQ